MNNFKIDKADTYHTDLLSGTITFLKFPLAVLVVILHADLITKPIERIGLYDLENREANTILSKANDLEISEPLYTNISWLLSRYLAYAAVPSFFVISGFLLFYKVKDYNR